MTQVKSCSTCTQALPLESFHKDKRRAHLDGRSGQCAECVRRYHKGWRNLNPDKPRWRDKNPEKDKANNAALHIKTVYDLDASEWQAMLRRQDGRCANPGCRTDRPGGRSGKFHVDHNHKTDRVRGLLCWGCNIAAGHLKDSPAVVRGLAQYLEDDGYVLGS